MDFKRIELRDIERIKPFFSYVESKTCDFTVGGMFMWRDYYIMEYSVCDGVLISRLKNENGEIYYNIPLGKSTPDAISLCVERFACPKIRFCTVPQEYIGVFERMYPHCTVTEQTDYADYLYSSEELISLKGKKFSPQRNLISQFKRNHPTWSFEEVNGSNIADVIDFFNRNAVQTGDGSVASSVESSMCFEVLNNLDSYGMTGLCLTVDEKIVGFSLGEISNDTLFVHIEKADRAYKGAYQLLMNCFAERFGADVQYINREEDMGSEGLRRAKQAYNPICLLKKYVVEIEKNV
ncbi:MAG: DUF2156 domain-containing protein [Clostridia bacterium]|nr:DUF2156 domain-containing protein [Clostridia bacterium]